MGKRFCENVKHAPIKAKVVWGNHKSYISKILRKTSRINFEKKRNISNNPETIKSYKKQKNYVVNPSKHI